MKIASAVSSVLAALAAVGGCSLINAFDDVVDDDFVGDASSDEGGTGGDVGGGGTGGVAGGAAGTAGATGGGGSGGTPPADGGAPDSGVPFVKGGPNGAIVAYSTPPSGATELGDLYVLDPETGATRIAEKIDTVNAVAYDGQSDVWYIWEATGTADAPHVLHVREMDTASWQWREVGRYADMPAPTGTTSVGVLNQRIAYLSFPDGVQTTEQAKLTILNTSDPSAVTFVGLQQRDLPAGDKFSLVADADRTQVGGGFIIGVQSVLGCTQCPVSLERYQINSLGPNTPSTVTNPNWFVNAIGGAASLTFDIQNRFTVLTIPPFAFPDGGAPLSGCDNDAVPLASVYELNGGNLVDSNPVTYELGSFRAHASAFNYCQRVVYSSTLLYDWQVFATPLTRTGTPTPSKLCQSGGSVTMAYEPYTASLFRVTDDSIEKYTVGGTDEAPTLLKVSFNLPQGFANRGTFTVRQPIPGNCN